MEENFDNLTRYPVHRLIFQNLQSGVLIVDEHNRIFDLNPAAKRILRLSGNEVIGRPLDAILPEQAAFLLHLQAGQEMPTEMDLEATGHVYALQITPFANDSGRSLGRIILFHDITQFKQSEAELRQYASEAEAQNRELEAFAHTVAHDLKSPLNALSLNQAIMQQVEEWTPEKIQSNAQRIAEIGNQMATIVDSLLLLARVRHQAPVGTRPLDMAAIVAKVLERLQGRIQATHAEVINNIDPWVAAVGYAPWVEEVWFNYLDNALKYSSAPPRIILGATAHGQTREIRFWVQDKGIGLTNAQQLQVFEPFTRFHPNFDGHGLGLSIVRRIVERLGGVVGVESVVGEGSTFYFTLPTMMNE